MAKNKTKFVCVECGAEFSKWQGQCSECKEWNTIDEVAEIVEHVANRAEQVGGYAGEGSNNKILKISEIKHNENIFLKTNIEELDHVFGGGVVEGGTYLIGGSPGAGKSTLLLQVAKSLSQSMNVLYTSGEESLAQIKVRSGRIKKIKYNDDNLFFTAKNEVNDIIKTCKDNNIKLLIVDSIQTAYLSDIPNSPGSVKQITECASTLNRFCKNNNVTLLVIGHITKDGAIAGPEKLKHIVDGAFLLSSLDNDSNSRFRLLTAEKYRFSNLETAFFAMTENGLQSVSNPSAMFIQDINEKASGSVITSIWEGTRPILVEIQSLVQEVSKGYPQVLSMGVDKNRITMQIAIATKMLNIPFSSYDVFVNLVGGMKSNETVTDLPFIIAMYSSNKQSIVSRELVSFGEVGLSGEIRPVVNGLERVKEASKAGFKYVIVPKSNYTSHMDKIKGIKVYPITNINEAIDIVDQHTIS